MRVRHFTQDDAHIFCTEEQMDAECRDVVSLVLDIYRQFGFDNVAIKLSTRPVSRMGDDATWDQLESALIQALDGLGLRYQLNPGEGAFYGPKLEFVLRDAIGRDWQCGTLQVDMNLPERFDIAYVAHDNQRKRPVMLHRALFGSLERFTGILLEHYAGKLPVWLAPVQAVVMSISEQHSDYAKQVAQQLRRAGIRHECDIGSEKISYKIRRHTLLQVPYLLIVGSDEVADGSVTLRDHAGTNLGRLPLQELMDQLQRQAHAPQDAGNANPLVDTAQSGHSQTGDTIC